MKTTTSYALWAIKVTHPKLLKRARELYIQHGADEIAARVAFAFVLHWTKPNTGLGFTKLPPIGPVPPAGSRAYSPFEDTMEHHESCA